VRPSTNFVVHGLDMWGKAEGKPKKKTKKKSFGGKELKRERSYKKRGVSKPEGKMTPEC